jgi:hypothetical protein
MINNNRLMDALRHNVCHARDNQRSDISQSGVHAQFCARASVHPSLMGLDCM